jgi:hypothetical protein
MPAKKVTKSVRKPRSAPKKVSVSVFDGGNLVREYSKEVHGKDFAKLAESLAAKKGFTVK